MPKLSSSVPRFHCAWIIGPMEFKFVGERSRESVQIRKQRGLRDVHAVKFAHSFFAYLIRRKYELDQRVLWVRIVHQNLFDRLIQNRRYQKSTGLRDEPAVHRVRLSEPYEVV